VEISRNRAYRHRVHGYRLFQGHSDKSGREIHGMLVSGTDDA
jgi:hypothetical protein